MLYRIGALTLRTSFALPADYGEFLVPEPEEDTPADVNVVWSAAACDLTEAREVAALSLMTVWSCREGWIFEDNTHKAFLTVDSAYADGVLFCREADRTDEVVRPLMQAILECRFIYGGAMVLHAACVRTEGKAIALSAPSGTGKSTRAEIWVRALGAEWISGDRPVIDPAKGIAHGAPWDGKEQIHTRAEAPLHAILRLCRSEETFVRRMTEEQKTRFLATQMMIPLWDTTLTQKAFLSLRETVSRIPVYKLYCGSSETAAAEARDILFRHNEKILEPKEEETMKMKENFKVAELAGDYMAVPTGKEMADYGGAVILNEVSAFILKAMQEPVTEEELLERILNEYDIDRETAAADLTDILRELMRLELIEE